MYVVNQQHIRFAQVFLFVCIYLTADGPQRASLPISPINMYCNVALLPVATRNIVKDPPISISPVLALVLYQGMIFYRDTIKLIV